MNRSALIGGGVLLLAVIGLSIWIGSLRRQVQDGEAMLAELTRQRDEAVERARTAVDGAAQLGLELAEEKMKAEAAGIVHAKVSADLARIRKAMVKIEDPVDLPQCMASLRLAQSNFAILDKSYQAALEELTFYRRALYLAEEQIKELDLAVEDYAEALRLDDARIETMRLTEKARKRKRIIGMAFGGLALVGAGIGGGYALARR